MFIGQYISTDYHEVLHTDTVEFVLEKMSESHSKFLAVVKGNVFHGLVSEETLLDQTDLQVPIENLKIHFKSVYLFDYQHIYDALQLITTYDYCFIPVLNKKHEYIGVLTKQDLLIALNETLGNDEGAIIVLELGMRDNALSHIARIIEAENTNILSTAIHRLPESSKLEMTIKVNKTNIAAVVSSLWRNDYVVKATFRDGGQQSDIQDRYDLLMNYLDL
ncbi:CBS domain-containing protein [Sphingobacterium yanglingense]|uniref:CBS domain protein n=1 Tax=Sphingobacterium yanglingense TaxID=1437280 RepID=A0A4R6WG40_9SPHI|nr:CBS domain-containing protein [Sphingobacterium yanglingense]TDQ77143.1 CBS domain protein [Sphingobacterium yanglingense]